MSVNKKSLVFFIILGVFVIPGPILTIVFSDTDSFPQVRNFHIFSFLFLFAGVLVLILLGKRIRRKDNIYNSATYKHLLTLVILVTACFLIRPLLWQFEYKSKIKKCSPLFEAIKDFEKKEGYYPKDLSSFSISEFPVLKENKLTYRSNIYKGQKYFSLNVKYEVDPFFMDWTRTLSKADPNIFISDHPLLKQKFTSGWKLTTWN